jgi:hypothetical protein
MFWGPQLYVGVGTNIKFEKECTVDSFTAIKIDDITVPKTDLGKRRCLGEWAIFDHLPDRRCYAQAQPITFVHSPGDPAEELRCWYLADSKEGGNLLSYWFITPFITLSENNRSITVVPRVTIDPQANWDASIYYQ